MINRKQWVTDFQTALDQIEVKGDAPAADKAVVTDMKAICTHLLAAQDAKPAMFGLPSKEIMTHMDAAKALGLKYFDSNDALQKTVPTGPLAVLAFKAYGEYAARKNIVMDLPMGASLLMPNYAKRNDSINEYLKAPSAYVSAAAERSSVAMPAAVRF